MTKQSAKTDEQAIAEAKAAVAKLKKPIANLKALAAKCDELLIP